MGADLGGRRVRSIVRPRHRGPTEYASGGNIGTPVSNASCHSRGRGARGWDRPRMHHATALSAARTRRPQRVGDDARRLIESTGPSSARARIRAIARPTRRCATAPRARKPPSGAVRSTFDDIDARATRLPRAVGTHRPSSAPPLRPAPATSTHGAARSGRHPGRRWPTDAPGMRSRAGPRDRPRAQRSMSWSRPCPHDVCSGQPVHEFSSINVRAYVR